jgi:predicted MFS family arabinose efflux permease
LPGSGAAARWPWRWLLRRTSCRFFQRFAPAGIAPDLIAAFNTTASSLGVLAATYFYVYTVMQVPTGILVDTLGPRLILLLGGLVGGVGSLLFGMAPNFDLALLGER